MGRSQKTWPAVIKGYLVRGWAVPDLDIPADDPAWVTVLVDLRNDRRAQATLLATVSPFIVALAVAHHLEFPKANTLPGAWLEALAPHQGEPDVHNALISGFLGALRRTEKDAVPPSRGAWPAVLAEMSGPPGWANRLVEAAMRHQAFGVRADLEDHVDLAEETVSQNLLREAIRVGQPHLGAADPETVWPWFVAHSTPLTRGGALLHALADESAWGVALLEANETLPVPLAEVLAAYPTERARAQFLDRLNAAIARPWVPSSLTERVYAAGRQDPTWLPVFADRYRADARQQALAAHPAAPGRPRRRT